MKQLVLGHHLVAIEHPVGSFISLGNTGAIGLWTDMLDVVDINQVDIIGN